eukprot:5505694-Pyramimonas_sp.AAC.1
MPADGADNGKRSVVDGQGEEGQSYAKIGVTTNVTQTGEEASEATQESKGWQDWSWTGRWWHGEWSSDESSAW